MAIIPIGAVLQLVQVEAKTGVLAVTDGKTEIAIAMREGLIDLVQARGAGSEFRLGRYFVEHGLITPDDLDRILRDNAPTPRPPPMDGDGCAASARSPARAGGSSATCWSTRGASAASSCATRSPASRASSYTRSCAGRAAASSSAERRCPRWPRARSWGCRWRRS